MPDIIWGRNTVREALKAGRKIERILVAGGLRGQGPVEDILRLAKEEKISVEVVERRRLDRFGDHHQGIVAVVAPFQYSSLEQILALAQERQEPPLLVMLDSVTDPQNFGAVVRTADAAGAHGVLVPRHRASGVTAVVEKASAGAVEYVRIAQVTNLARSIEDLKEQGVWSVGLDASSTKSVFDLDYTAPTIFVLGSEGKGLGHLVRERCDLLARIPMKGMVSSLNVSVAAGVVLYEALRQRSVVGNQPRA